MLKSIECRCFAVLSLEEFDEMGGVCETATFANLCNGLFGGDQQQARVLEPLRDHPFVGGFTVAFVKLFFEGCETLVGELSQLLDGGSGEKMLLNNPLKILNRGVQSVE